LVDEPEGRTVAAPPNNEEPKKTRERESTPPSGAIEGGIAAFDFDAHRRAAIDAYTGVRDVFERYATDVQKILRVALKAKGVQVLTVDCRAKTADSFGRKAASRSEADPTKPKYPKPLEDITDLAGVRVVAFYPSSIPTVCACIEEEFGIVERVDLRASMMAEDRFGYLSVHYIVRLTDKRTPLAEYGQYDGLRAEIQVRTILQHAWAEIEHGIQYKSTTTLPIEIHRRLLALAGLLEVADREFEGIRDADELVRRVAAASIAKGEPLDQVEITPDALRLYLDKRLGPDARMADYSYEYEAKRLRMLGFRTFAQVDECIKGRDDDAVSRIVAGGRQGQLSRFNYLIQAGMGDQYLNRLKIAQPSTSESWWDYIRGPVQRLRKANHPVGNYSPPPAQGGDEIEHE
jgi:putative GTP pyrophosphokinase